MNDAHEKSLGDTRSREEMMALLLAIREQGVMDSSLLNVFEATPRRMFLNAGQVQGRLGPKSGAPIACGQVQTPPTVIAGVIQALDIKPTDKVLEVGTGSGYQSALIARTCGKLYSIDRFKTLIAEAEQRFRGLKLTNIITRVSDGELGWPEQGSFDCIVINAGVRAVPTVLLDQLKPEGKIVAPILQEKTAADIVLHIKAYDGLKVEHLRSARFLPLIPGIAVNL